MPRKGEKRDPLLDCPNVKIFRDVVHLQMNYLQRQYVAKNVSCCERGQAIWRATLTEWMLHGFSPKNVVGMIKLWEGQFYSVENPGFQEYSVEARGTDAAKLPQRTNGANGHLSQRLAHAKNLSPRIPERSDSHLSRMPENEGIQFRAGSDTLEEIVTKALRKGD